MRIVDSAELRGEPPRSSTRWSRSATARARTTSTSSIVGTTGDAEPAGPVIAVGDGRTSYEAATTRRSRASWST